MTDQFSEDTDQVEKVTSYDRLNGKLDVHYAGFWIRLWAYLFDLLVIGCLKSIVVNPFVSHDTLQITSWLNGQLLLHALIFYAYFVLMTKFFRQTLGKMVFGLKVNSENEGELSWKDVIFREWVGRYISVTLIIPFVTAAFLPRKRALHDIFADTVVIHEGTYKINHKKTPALT